MNTPVEMKMTPEEIEKKVEDAAYDYDAPYHGNCFGCCQSDSDYQKAFVSGAHYGVKLGRAQGIRDVIDYVRLTALYGYGVAHEIEQHFAEDLKEQG